MGSLEKWYGRIESAQQLGTLVHNYTEQLFTEYLHY